MIRLFGSILVAFLIIGCSQEKSDESAKSNVNSPIKNAQITIKKGDENMTNAQQNAWMSYDIDGVKRPKFGVGDDNNLTTNAIGALAFTRTPLQSINRAVIKGRLSKNFITKCSACHDDYANGIIGPSLLNKSADEIFDMINAYKTRTKANILMADLVKRMDESEIRALAKEISEFNEQFRSKK